MTELKEIKLRKQLYQPLFDYFSDNLPAHLYPPQRIDSTVFDLLDVIIDSYESNSQMERGHLLD